MLCVAFWQNVAYRLRPPKMPEITTLFLDAAPYRLRPLLQEDATTLHHLVNDWEVVRMLSRLPFPYPRDLADEWIAATQAMHRTKQGYHFAILDAQNRFVGCVGLRVESLPKIGRVGLLGYWVGRAYWGQGIATKAATRLAHWALANLDITCLRATVAQDNVPSAHVLERAGFKAIGTDRQMFVARGTDHPVSVYEMTRTDIDMPEQPPTTRKLVLVSAAALVDTQGRILLARRPEGKSLAGLWEFPGGKMEPGESAEAALIRELDEELGVDVSRSCLAPFTFASHSYATFDLLMPLFLCRRWSGTPTGREGQALAWVPVKDLRNYPMPEADLPFIALLQETL